MSKKIEQKQKMGWRERAEKTNEIINSVNPLLNIKIQMQGGVRSPSVVYSTDGVIITIPDYQDQIDATNRRIDGYHP